MVYVGGQTGTGGAKISSGSFTLEANQTGVDVNLGFTPQIIFTENRDPNIKSKNFVSNLSEGETMMLFSSVYAKITSTGFRITQNDFSATRTYHYTALGT